MSNLVKSYIIEYEDFRFMRNPTAYNKLSSVQNVSMVLHGLITAQAATEIGDLHVSWFEGQSPLPSGARKSPGGVFRMVTNDGWGCKLDWDFLNDDGIISKPLILRYYKLQLGNYILYGQPKKFTVEPGTNTKNTFWLDSAGIKRNSEELTKELFDRLKSFS